ncbi:MAG: hypothetical protein JWO67_7427 [Streptosporangiaceae bacterium]|nr:hypothetical protein [Streptosporangiaceae bacterium]
MGTRHAAGRHHANDATILEHHAWHLAKVQLGLDDEDYQRLARRVQWSAA